ncbi:MAG: PIN domain-containing protein [Candidatus Heimdallarchaeota archaeon]|nr:PIN domain-containing protein [Candidatus Heimdallarchaeota archaeon]
MIADTCFIIDLMRRRINALEKLKLLEEKGERQYITTPTIFELVIGIKIANKPEKETKKVFSVLKNFAILDLTAESAWIAGMKLGELNIKGQTIDPIDAQIAGIAINQNEVLVTRNVKHFERITKLKIDSYNL